MNNKASSLFSRLYKNIVLTVIFSVFCTSFIIEIYIQQEEFNFFTRFSTLSYEYLEAYVDESEYVNGERVKLPLPLEIDFSAKFYLPSREQSPCIDCEFIKEENNKRFYELEEGEFMVEYPWPNSERKLLLYQKIDEERARDELFIEEEPDPAPVAFGILIFFTSAFLGITIYRPIKGLQNHIKALTKTHQEFGAGNLVLRADDNIQPPIDQLAKSFNKMAQAIADNVKERDIFAQAIPHEVRTPLSRIQLASGLIRQRSEDLDVLTLLDDVDNYVVDINELISQIVVFSRVNDYRGEQYEQTQTIKVKDFIAARIKLLNHHAEKPVQLSGDGDVEIIASPICFRLLVDNFIKNAMNYCVNQVHVSVLTEAGKMLLKVEDDGKGIAEKDWRTIFIPFARLDESRNRSTGGLGLGLPIAKAASEKMQGEIKVSQSKMGGACFSFAKQIA